MSTYNWSNKYQTSKFTFNTDRKSYEEDRPDRKLRQTIDLSSLRSGAMQLRIQKKNSDPPESLRSTTTNTTSVTNLLSKTYNTNETPLYEPKSPMERRATYENSRTAKKISNFRPQRYTSDFSWYENRFKKFQSESLKTSDSKSNHFQNYKINTPILRKQSTDMDSCESPSAFLKSKKVQYQSPYEKNDKDEAETVCTKISSPKTVSALQAPISPTKYRSYGRAPRLEDFTIVKNLGQGRFGTVSMVIHKESNLIFALKRVKKSVIKANKIENQFIMELKIQMFLNHPNILKLYAIFDDFENFYLILEYVEEGTLYGKLKKAKKLPEQEASSKMNDVLHAVKYMHEQEIAHRDIKPQNIVLSNGVCKLCDFGWSAVCDSRRTTLCGTIDYAPPEVLEGKEYGISMDLWCLGVLSYELLVGKAPFYHMSRKETMNRIIAAETNELKIPSDLSSDAVSFIKGMLVKDPQDRTHAEDSLKHSFIQKHLDADNEKLRVKSK